MRPRWPPASVPSLTLQNVTAYSTSRAPILLQPGNTQPQRARLPFTDHDLCRCRVRHDKQESALEVRLNLLDARQIHQHFPASTKEYVGWKASFELPELIIHPECLGPGMCLHQAILHLEPEN